MPWQLVASYTLILIIIFVFVLFQWIKIKKVEKNIDEIKKLIHGKNDEKN